MNIEHLELDEFDVECNVRDITSTNIGERLELLSQRLELEKLHPVLIPTRPHKSVQKSPKRELEKISVKLHFLYIDLHEATQEDNAELTIKLHSRLLHLESRLMRLKYSKSVKDQVTETLTKISQLVAFVVKNLAKDPNQLNESIHELDQIKVTDAENTSEPEDENDSDSSSREASINLKDTVIDINKPSTSVELNKTPTGKEMRTIQSIPANLKPTDSVSHSTEKPLANFHQFPPLLFNDHSQHNLFKNSQKSLSKWGIIYNGTPNDLHIKRFLMRVEHLAKSEKIPTQRLVTDLHYILKGNANEWYWTFIERNPNITWDNLKVELNKCFQGPRTDDDIRSQMEGRKQKHRESFCEFYQELISMSLQLEVPITDQEIIRIIKRNMRAGLQDKLTNIDITSVDNLFRKCLAYEDTWNRTGFMPELMCQNRKYVNTVDAVDQICEPIPAYFPTMSSSTSYTYPTLVESQANHLNLSALNLNRGAEQPMRQTFTPNNGPNVGVTHNNPVTRNENRRPDWTITCAGCGSKGYHFNSCFKCNPPPGNWRAEERNPSISILRHNNRVEAASNTDPELYKRQTQK